MNDIKRIAFVTAHFEELKGLKIALYGAGLLFGSLLLVASAGSDTAMPSPFVAMVFANMLMGFAFFDLEPRYRNTFGNAVNFRIAPGAAGISQALGSFGLLTTMALMIGPLTDVAYLHRPGPSIGAVAIAAASLLVVIRDWRWRPHYLVPCVSGIVAAVITSAVRPTPGIQPWEGDPRRTPAFLIGYSLIGLGLVTAGLFDHRLLATAMRGPQLTGGVPGRRRTRPFSVALASFTAIGAGAALSSTAPANLGIALSLLLAVCVFVATMVSMVGVSARRLRIQRRSPAREDGFLLSIGDREVALLLLTAVAAASDALLVPGARPFATSFAFSLFNLSVVLSDPRRNIHYLTGVAAGAGVLIWLPRFTSSQAFALFVCAAAGSLAIEWGVNLIHELRHANAV